MSTRAPRARKAHGRSEIWDDAALVRDVRRVQKKLGQRLHALRHERGLTQEVASERAHLSLVQVSRIETGDSNVTIASLVALARAYGVELPELFE